MKNNEHQFTSPLRYPGGKFRARRILQEFIPDDTKTILSPFFGGGSFELHLNNQGIKVIGYDNFWLLSNFWEQLLENPQTIASKSRPHLGTISKGKFKEFQQELKAYSYDKKSVPSTDRKQELAVKFFIVNRCSFSGSTLSGGYSQSASESRFTESIVNKLESFSNPLLSVSYSSFEQTLPHYANNETIDLLFLDPPYLLGTHKNKLYGKNGDMHREFNHSKLRNEVEKSEKLFVLTYNDCEEIRELWKGYYIQEAEWNYGMNQSKKSSELIITNIKQ